MKGIHRHNTGTRDAALRRLTSANRWLIAGSVALTAMLSEVAAQAFPGKKLSSANARSTSSAKRTRTHTPASEEFHPPENAPQASSESPASEAQPSQGGGDSGSAESSSPSGESASPESAPQPSESSPPAEAPSQAAPEASSESPPVVSGGS